MMNYTMNLKDGGVIAIDTGYDYKSGCPTCDWGAERTNRHLQTHRNKHEYSIQQKTYRFSYTTDTNYPPPE